VNLTELLDSPQAHHVNPRAATLRVVGKNSQGESVKVEAAPVVFRFVTEQERAEAYRDADAEVRKTYKDRDPPIDRLVTERNYHLLLRALRDSSDPTKPLFASALQLRNSLVLEEAQRVFAEYDGWISDEFPPSIDDETMKKLIDDAKKNSLSDLITSYGYEQIRTALPSLAAQSG
jgi:hypothetical protein